MRNCWRQLWRVVIGKTPAEVWERFPNGPMPADVNDAEKLEFIARDGRDRFFAFHKFADIAEQGITLDLGLGDVFLRLAEPPGRRRKRRRQSDSGQGSGRNGDGHGRRREKGLGRGRSGEG